MKRVLNVLTLGLFLIALITGCQKDDEVSQISNIELESVETEATADAAMEEVDEIAYYSLLSASGGRIAEDENSPIRCAEITHDRENKRITIDFGEEGCRDWKGRIRTGIINIDYTDHRLIPGAVHIITFDNFTIDGVAVAGSRTITNTAETLDDFLSYSIEVNMSLTWPEDGTTYTRIGTWYRERIRTPNPINDQIIVTGGVSGINRRGLEYSVEITKDIVWKRGCLLSARVFVPVEGIKVKTVGDDFVLIIDFGDGTCDNLATVTKNGVEKTIELTRFKPRG
jgi:hypothetical protein